MEITHWGVKLLFTYTEMLYIIVQIISIRHFFQNIWIILLAPNFGNVDVTHM